MVNFLSREILQDKFRGAILGCFLGDAFGSGFEGMDPARAQFHMGNLSKKSVRSYTDDTDMTLALAESIIRCGKVDPEDIANQFHLSCDLTRGYSGGAIRAVLALRAGLKWHQVGESFLRMGPSEMEQPCESLLSDSSFTTIWTISRKQPFNRPISPISIPWGNGEP